MPRHRGLVCLGFGWWVLTLFLVAGGCASGLEPVGEPGARVVVADWDDVDAAVEVAVKRSEVGLAGPARREEGRVVFPIRTISDEAGELVVTRGEGDRVTVEASIGRFGDAAWESRVVGAVARRLRELGGVEWAPVK
jgi:hypothetical protein